MTTQINIYGNGTATVELEIPEWGLSIDITNDEALRMAALIIEQVKSNILRR